MYKNSVKEFDYCNLFSVHKYASIKIAKEISKKKPLGKVGRERGGWRKSYRI